MESSGQAGHQELLTVTTALQGNNKEVSVSINRGSSKGRFRATFKGLWG